MEPSQFIDKLIQLNHLDVVDSESDKHKVQDLVLQKYKDLETIRKLLNEDFAGASHLKKGDRDLQQSSNCVKPYLHTTFHKETVAPIPPHTSEAEESTSEEEIEGEDGYLHTLHPRGRESLEIDVPTFPYDEATGLAIPTTPTEFEKFALEHLPRKPPAHRNRRAKFYPKDKPPAFITLPFHQQAADGNMNAYTEAPRTTHGGIRTFTKGNDPLLVPSWLIQIPEFYVALIQQVKDVLANVKDPNNPVEEINTLTDLIRTKMKLTMISKQEICDVLRQIPLSKAGSGFSFGHFLFALGNPKLASRKGVFIPFPRNLLCVNGEDAEDGEPSLQSQRLQAVAPHHHQYHHHHHHHTRKHGRIPDKHTHTEIEKEHHDALADYLDRADTDQGATPEVTEDQNAELRSQKEKENLREQIFYSGLLHIQMFETLENLNKILAKRQFEPPVQSSRQKFSEKIGIGIKKLGSEPWDIGPQTPRISPYLSPRSLCVPRLQIHVPTADDQHVKGTKVNVKFMHYMVHAPPVADLDAPIKLTENRERIRKALKHLASQGDCLALVPDFERLLHFGDANVHMTKEIHKTKKKLALKAVHSRVKTKYENSEDLRWIVHECRKQYVPARLPPRLAKFQGIVPLSFAMMLKKEAQKIQDQVWTEAERRRENFKDALWKRLDVLSIPTGQIRNNFVYAFETLMPEFPQLATFNHKLPNQPWHF